MIRCGCCSNPQKYRWEERRAYCGLESLHSAQILTRFDATAWLQQRTCDQCRLKPKTRVCRVSVHLERTALKCSNSKSADFSQENFSSALFRPASPIRRARSRSCNISQIAFANATGSSGSTRKPVRPWSTVYVIPPTRGATTGSLCIMASTRLVPYGSFQIEELT